MKTTGKKTLGERINALLTRMIRFVTYDIWRITENEVSGLKSLYQHHQDNNSCSQGVSERESSNESLCPHLQHLAIHRASPGGSVGDSQRVRLPKHRTQELFDYFPGHEVELTKAFEFVESYLEQAQGGVIIGVGLILLFIQLST